ncbi:MAG: aldehyde dehydrogenase [Bordetella sp. SCN 67-23]|nr:aldehyde dehydrogenase [Burkholderiales bacterium]ODS72958.1 MAG: aldehyde dehydrogenase [Bordetella sp. SCN 67-23]OJW93545.1 MAG: aldehyde dehydrogenase [Burkholderiales bacterium 67-32]
MYEFGNFIEGTWTPGQGKPFSTCNPARPAEKVGAYSAASAEQVDGAVAAAARAQTKWGVRPAVERGQELTRFVNALEEMSEQIAIAITREQGKPLAESRGEVAKACGEARFMIGEASRSHGTVMPSSRPGFSNMVTRRPRGVIAALSPWNFPIMTPMRKIMPALVFGNAVILKPSEYAPAAACMVADAAKDFLPPGLLQIVLGMVEPGQAMVSHPGIDGITFTGSAAVGKKIYGAAAQHLAEVSLELGGKNAAVIHDVNDLDSCLDQIVSAAYQCAGQRCTGISRVVVDAGLKDRVVAGLVDRVGRIRVGDGMLDGVAMGPMTNAAQFEKVAQAVEAGVAEGARVSIGGHGIRVEQAEGGYFYAPTVLSEVTPVMSVAREEIFGPVLVVLSYSTLDEAFDILNGVEYGLTSALFSNDQAVIQRFMRESQSGMLHVNHGTVPENHMPFGGIRNSGVGAYSVGPSAINFYTTEHAIYVKAQ